MTRIHSLSHGVKQEATPYESVHTKTSPYHRIHTSKKNRIKDKTFRAIASRKYKQRLEELKINELEDEQ
jgi:hypothetical protein